MKSIKEITNKEEMKWKLFTYHKLIDWMDDYYFNDTEMTEQKRVWIGDNWIELCRSLGETFEEMVEDGWNSDQRTLQEIVNDDLEELMGMGWSVRDIRDRGEDLVEDLHTQNIGTLKEIGWCFESWVEENWERN